MKLKELEKDWRHITMLGTLPHDAQVFMACDIGCHVDDVGHLLVGWPKADGIRGVFKIIPGQEPNKTTH